MLNEALKNSSYSRKLDHDTYIFFTTSKMLVIPPASLRPQAFARNAERAEGRRRPGAAIGRAINHNLVAHGIFSEAVAERVGRGGGAKLNVAFRGSWQRR